MTDTTSHASRGRDEVYLNFIGGQWRQGSTPDWDENRNPARPNDVLGKSTRSTAADVGKAIEAAAAAQKEWARKPRTARAAVLEKVAQLMRSRIDTFAKTITLEEGKNFNEARGETLKSINVLEFTASEGRRPTGEVIPSDMPNTLIYTTRSPLGVVGIITPWNFPLCIPVWKIAPGLLEGNAIVFKAATLTPATAKLLVFTFEEAGLPAGVLNLVYGSGAVVGNAIVDDPRVKAISFTGSNEVGTELYARAARRGAHVQLEMGGKNPVIVCADADLDQAVEATVMGAFGSTGQRCTATSRVVVERSVQKAFVEKLLPLVRAIKVGDGITNPSAMGPVVDIKQYKSVLKAIEDAKSDGAKLVCGGEPCTAPGGGHFVTPTVFDDVKPSMRLAREEVFGPVLAIIPVDGFEEAIEVSNNVEYGLSSSIYTNDVKRVMQYADRIETGMMHVNSPTVGGEAQAPFGGCKATGIGGREMGSTGPQFFCEIKTMYIDYNTTVRKTNTY
ncbi:MAG: aldehyde dehydrogenase family protein [Deltaproteobacteria bacterium]|nr:aldehyde dehydrogenase family protein [Deltaproteobacteria bacterium]